METGPQQASDCYRGPQITFIVSLSCANKKNNESHSKNRTTATDPATKQRRENNNKNDLSQTNKIRINNLTTIRQINKQAQDCF